MLQQVQNTEGERTRKSNMSTQINRPTLGGATIPHPK